MRIEHLAKGWRITIPETENNMEFSYDLPIMTDGPEHIMAEQARIARKFAVRAFCMENRFKNNEFDGWAEKNRIGGKGEMPILGWNKFFHDELQVMLEESWALWREWCDWHWETYGWNAY